MWKKKKNVTNAELKHDLAALKKCHPYNAEALDKVIARLDEQEEKIAALTNFIRRVLEV